MGKVSPFFKSRKIYTNSNSTSISTNKQENFLPSSILIKSSCHSKFPFTVYLVFVALFIVLRSELQSLKVYSLIGWWWYWFYQQKFQHSTSINKLKTNHLNE
jgi:hypothetical protein